MFDIKLKVAYSDGREAVLQVRPIDQVRFEAKYDLPITAAFASGARLTYVYFLAWSASGTDLPFEKWLETVEAGDLADAEEVAPFVEASSAGTSPA